jgi:hypothetical protein
MADTSYSLMFFKLTEIQKFVNTGSPRSPGGTPGENGKPDEAHQFARERDQLAPRVAARKAAEQAKEEP